MAEPVRQMTLRTPEPARCSHCDAPLAPGEYHPNGCPQPTDWKAEAALWKKEFDDARDHYEDILSEQDAEIERLRARVAEMEDGRRASREAIDFDPLTGLPACVRCPGERCLPECEFGLGNLICPRDAAAPCPSEAVNVE